MMKRRLAAVGLLISAGWLAGCGGSSSGKATMVRRPQWAYERYERIGVLAGRAVPREAVDDAVLLTDRLTTLLTQNGTFTVLSRSDLQDVMTEQDLSLLADAVDQGTALPQGKIKIAQAVITATITDYHLISEKEKRTIPRYALDKRGRRLLSRRGRPIKVGEDVVWIYKHGAAVEGSIRVSDAATGEVLFSHTARIQPKSKKGRNRPPSMSPEDIARVAVAELAVDFYKRVAPVRMEVDFDKDMLIVATDYYDGRYEKTKKLPRTLPEFLLVIRELEPECERNNFRVTITAKEGRQNLFEEEFVWSGNLGPEGQSYVVPMGALTQTGSDEFVAKLYSVGNPEPVIKRKFKLEEIKDG